MSDPCPAGCNGGLVGEDICPTCNGSGEARPANKRRAARAEPDVEGPFEALRLVLDARAPELVPLVKKALELQASGGLPAVEAWLAEVAPLTAEERDGIMESLRAGATPHDAARAFGVTVARWDRLYAETPALRAEVEQKRAESKDQLVREAANGSAAARQLLAIRYPEEYAPRRKG